MDRGNHYEAAFEAFLQWHRLGYIAIDETRRSFLDDEPVKNLDFLVFGESGSRLLVDVKGRRFPGGPAEKPRRVWECWTKSEDVDGLLRWQDRFGFDYHAVFVFTYHLHTNEIPDVNGDLWTWRGRRYYFRAVSVADYAEHMKLRSPKWETVDLPGADYRKLSLPFQFFTREFAADVEVELPF